jgi:hypothetical protein
MNAPTNDQIERLGRNIARIEAELQRRVLDKIVSGEAKALRVIVHEGDDEAAVCERARKEAGLSEGQAVFIVRKIVAPSDEFLQRMAEYRAESQAREDERYAAAQDEWTPPPRVTIPDQLNPTPIYVVIDDNERIPDTLASYYIVAEGHVMLSDQGGKPLARGTYSHPLREGEQADRIAKRLLVKFDLDRGRGSGEIAYLETRR